MNKLVPHSHLRWLPKAFLDSSGRVDVELLRELFAAIHKPSKKIKDLLARCSSRSISKGASPYEQLAMEILAPEFRRRWYQDRDRKNSHSVNPLFALIEIRSERKYPSLNKNDGVVSVAFDRRKGAWYPKLDHIGAIVDELAKIPSRDAALCLWGWFENCAWYSGTQPDELSLSGFESAVMDLLLGKSTIGLIGLLSPCEVRQDVNSGVRTDSGKLGSDESVNNGDVTTTPGLVVSSGLEVSTENDNFGADFRIRTVGVSRLWKTYAERAMIGLESGGLISQPAKAIRQLTTHVSALRDCLTSIDGESRAFISDLNRTLESVRTILPVTVTTDSISPASELGEDGWMAVARKHHMDVLVAVSQTKALENISPDLMRAAASRLQRSSISLTELSSYCEDLSEEVGLLDRAQRAKALLISKVEAKWHDFAWSPLSDSELSRSTYVDIARYLLQEAKPSPFLGILVRHCFESLEDEFAEHLRRGIGDTNISPLGHICELSRLTLAQIERLGEKDSEFSVLLSIVELESYLRTLNDPGTKSGDYLSAAPLQEFLDPHGRDEDFAICLNAVLDFLLSNTSSTPLNDLKEGILKAVSMESVDSAAAIDPVLKLKESLVFHPGGGGNYAKLWRRAYEEEFAPLRRVLERHGIERFGTSYASWLGRFDFEKRMHEWKSELASSVRKNSEYDKNIRLAIEDQKEKIEKALNSVAKRSRSELPDVSPQFSHLVSAIKQVRASADRRASLVMEWLSLVGNGEMLPNVWPITISYSIGAAWERAIPFPGNATQPRTYLRKESATFGDLAGDELIAEFGFGASKFVAEAYIRSEQFEAFDALYVNSESDIPVDLVRNAETGAERLFEQLQKHLVDIERRIAGFGSYLSVDVPNIENLRSLVTSRLFKKAEEEIQYFEYALGEIEARLKSSQEIQKLNQEIVSLGGAGHGLSRVEDLRALHKNLFEKAAPRRKHIDVVRDLVSLEQEAPMASNLMRKNILFLEQPENLPSEDQAGYAALALQPAVEFLVSELRRVTTLSKPYASKLQKTAYAVARGTMNPENFTKAESPFLGVLAELEPLWKRIAGQERLLDQILHKIEGTLPKDSEIGSDVSIEKEGSPDEPPETPSDLTLASGKDNEEEAKEFVARVEQWVGRMSIKEYDGLSTRAALNSEIADKSWSNAAAIAHSLFMNTPEEQIDRKSEALTALAICRALSDGFPSDLDIMAGVLRLANQSSRLYVVQSLDQVQGKGGMRLGELTRHFLKLCVERAGLIESRDKGGDPSPAGWYLAQLSGGVGSIAAVAPQLRTAFDICRDSGRAGQPLIVRDLWKSFTGDNRQEHLRADLMNVLWRSSATSALAFCLMQFQGLDDRRAQALAIVADDAVRGLGIDGLQSFVDLRGTISAVPFRLFVDHLQALSPDLHELPAKLRFAGPIELVGSANRWRGVMEIEPRRTHSPDTIVVNLPPVAPLRFGDGLTRREFKGPFLKKSSFAVDLQLQNERATSFPIEAECTVTTITGLSSKFSCTLQVETTNAAPFTNLSSDALTEAFDDFPHVHLREKGYIQRDEDESRIERLLFGGRAAKSIWIASPRRSGKTTMLFRILDQHSLKPGKVHRDNAIAYFTLDRPFPSDAAFNRWLWEQFREPDNEILRKALGDFDGLGRALPFDQEAKRFISELINEIKKRTSCDRVIFLLDEVDRFTEGHLKGGEYHEFVHSFMWQMRHLISSRPDFALVFSGAPSSWQFFVKDAKAAFYNHIDELRLTPFSTKTRKAEELSRAVAEPRGVQGHYTLPKASLEHILWICAGIPYYVRLLAGATFATVSQSYVLESDVTHALVKLLDHNTGLSKLDTLPDPGADEYGRIYAQSREDELLAKAVLLTVARMHSPISKYRLLRGQLWAGTNPLVQRYFLSRDQIERGLDICIKLDLLEQSRETPPEISFGIPILGETLNRNFGKYWADIEEDIERLGQVKAG